MRRSLSAVQYRACVAPDVDSVADLPPFLNEPKKVRKKRSRGEQIINPYEHTIQEKVVGELRRMLAPGYIVKANVQEREGEACGSKAHRMGQVAGFPDLEIMGDGKCFCIEMKDRDGRLKPAQKATHKLIIAAGIPLLPICRNLETAVAFLKFYGARFRDGR